jgi:hypothetical protein
LGAVSIIIMQYVYLYRINWEKEAEKASRLGQAEQSNEYTDQNDLTMENPLNRETESHSQQLVIVEPPIRKTGLKAQIVKKLLIAFIFIVLLIVSIFIHSL